MGQLDKARRSHEGAKRSAYDSLSAEIALPIFRAPLFDPVEHRVENWMSHPRDSGFAGLDTNNWGVNSVGVVTCINIPLCRKFSTSHPQNWSTFWGLEHNQMEAQLETRRAGMGHAALLRRLITFVRVDNPGFIPEPEAWVVSAPTDFAMSSVRSGTTGRLTLRRKITEPTERIRGSAFTTRATWPDFTQENQWA